MDTPPGFAEYPRPQGLPAGVPSLPSGAHIEAIGEAWTLYKANSSVWSLTSFVAGLIYFIVSAPFGLLSNMLQYGQLVPPIGATPISNPVGFLEGMAVQTVPVIVYTFLGSGMLLMALKQLRGAPIQVGDLFSGGKFLGRLIVAYILTVIAIVAGCVLCVIPGFWATGAFSLTPFLILDQGQGSVDAMRGSLKAAGGFGMGLSMFGLLFLLGILNGIGLLVCGVGVLVALPVVVLAFTIHYFYFFPEAFASTTAPQPSLG
jgi:hypothetical protein